MKTPDAKFQDMGGLSLSFRRKKLRVYHTYGKQGIAELMEQGELTDKIGNVGPIR